jgi:hypothetical protein
LLEAAVRAVGIRKGIKVASYAAEWALVANKLGRAPAAWEVGAEWGWSPAASYRRQAEWREAFPNVPTPEPCWRAAEERLGKLEDLAGAVNVMTQMPAPS